VFYPPRLPVAQSSAQRHHVRYGSWPRPVDSSEYSPSRFFPINENDREADRSGNCKAGTVVDRDIVHPTEFDFYLQAHGGLLGKSAIISFVGP
jgi:hypothetical protein